MRRPRLPLRTKSPVLTPRVKKGTWQKLMKAGTNRLNNRVRGVRTSRRGA